MTIIGPAVGYVTGGQLLLLYTDFLTVDPLTYVRNATPHYSHPVYMLIYVELPAYPRLPYYRIYCALCSVHAQTKKDTILVMKYKTLNIYRLDKNDSNGNS